MVQWVKYVTSRTPHEVCEAFGGRRVKHYSFQSIMYLTDSNRDKRDQSMFTVIILFTLRTAIAEKTGAMTDLLQVT